MDLLTWCMIIAWSFMVLFIVLPAVAFTVARMITFGVLVAKKRFNELQEGKNQ